MKAAGRISGFKVLSVALVIFILMTVTAFAGAGDGSGGGSSIALDMTSSVPADGAGDVSLQPSMTFQFSHNVAQAEISESNLSHISMKKADGSNVKLKTWVADIQIEFDKRQMLFAQPAEPLEPGTKYIVTLSAGIQAKNGMTTESSRTITFTTEGKAASETAATSADNKPADQAVKPESGKNAEGVAKNEETAKGSETGITAESGEAADTSGAKAEDGDVASNEAADETANADTVSNSDSDQLTAGVASEASSLSAAGVAGAVIVLCIILAAAIVLIRRRNK